MPPTRSLSPLSALTALTDDEDEADAHEPVRDKTGAEEAYGLVLEVVEDLQTRFDSVQLPPERRQDLTDTMKLLGVRASQKPYKVAIVGRTGSGKSTLLNALLQCSLLPTSGKGAACTSVVTEISYGDGREITARILYKSPEQWKIELNHLVADALEEEADDEESEDTSPAYQAREKLYQIYPHLRQLDVTVWNADSLLADPAVSNHLGKEPTISGSDGGDFGKKLEQFLSSCGGRAIWPLVESVHISGPFPVLSTGITLVDLPGHGDVDNARNKAANQYMRDASAVFLVTSIGRAIDDRDTHQYLQNHLSQIVVDGRIGEKSIALVLTGTDVPFDEKGVEIDLATDITKLTTQIEVLKKRIENGKPEKAEEWRKKVTAKRQAREQRILLRNNLLAQRRSHAVASALREKCQHIYRSLSQLPEDQSSAHIPIFCVGSCDYLSLSHLLPAAPLVFSSKEDTSIPALHEYIQLNGEFHNLTDGIDVLSMMYQLLNRASHAPSGDSVGPEMQQEIVDLEKRCTDRALTLVQSVDVIFKRIAAEVVKAVNLAEKRSPTVFEKIARLKWNQYLALMRREGEYGPTDLNADLTAPILPSVQTQWHLGVNVEIPALLSVFFQELKVDLDNSIQTLQVRSSTNVDTVRKSLGVESFVKELSHVVQRSIALRQRQGNRIWAPLIKEQLAPQYGLVAAERGRGMFGRMKELNMTFIRDSAHAVFEPLNAGTCIAFAGNVGEVQTELLGGIKRILREVSLLFIGFENTMSRDLEGLALLKTILLDKEDQIFGMMDALKLRRQEIELHLSP
ncbi:hypothetical protein B0H11DRAFT_2024898 [Mycena galericulata]|nr:hypothetical protein B0H11DRAFT_2024898 [Mycena galericulata]